MGLRAFVTRAPLAGIGLAFVVAVLTIAVSASAAVAGQRGQVGGPTTIALGPPDEGARTTPDLVIGRSDAPAGSVELVAYGWLAPRDSLPSASRKQLCVWVEYLPKEISPGMCGPVLDPSGTQKVVVDDRIGALGKSSQRFLEVGGRLTPDVASVRVSYRRDGHRASSMAMVAQVTGELQRKLHQLKPFGYFDLKVRGRVPWRSIRVQALGDTGQVLGEVGPASSTAAKHAHFVIDARRTMEAHLRGSKGFGFSLFANSGHVYLTVKGHNASVQYATSGRTSKRRIEARFGALGRVSLRFRPTAGPHLIPMPEGNCKGGGELVQPGTFVGTLEFEGEQGYTAAHATRIKGKITRTMAETCDEEGHRSSVRWTILHARSANGAVSVIAFATESASRPAFDGSAFSASLIEFNRRGMSTFRTIESSASLDAFSATKSHGKVISATVEPPAPFTGSATYVRSPDSPSESWTGSLAGDFPGMGRVSLAGPEFCAESVLLSSCDDSANVVTFGAGF